MATTNFKTENNTLRKLIGNGLTYRIPRFQRDYSWEVEQWEDLWADIITILNDEYLPSHYMGYLVLQSSDDKSFDVIDGQQRLTTTTLLILAILKNLQRLIDAGDDAENNKRRLEQIRQTYIGYLDPVTLIPKPKLILNRNNNDYFQNYLVPLGNLPQRGFRSSEHLLRKAFDWFDKKVTEYLKNITQEEGRHLAQLVENICDHLFFTVITVNDELNAYKVFETLNARGVRLSSTDLLKNYLFSVLDRNQENDFELKTLENRWERIVSRLQSEKFPDFLRVYWNSRYKLTRQADLFKVIRNNIKEREAIFLLIRGMEEDLDNYLALSSPEASDWSNKDKEYASILKMFRVRQPFSLLLAAKRIFSSEDFTSLLRTLIVISFRYNTIGAYSPAELERTYNSVAEQISKGDLRSLNAIWGLLKPIYIDDSRFKANFSEKIIKTEDSRSKRIVRYILCELEKQLSGSSYDFSSDSFNIEHVLPQKAPDSWEGFTYDETDALVYRLGNMTLLNNARNRDLGIEIYSTKRAVFEKSNFAITRKLAEDNTEWSPAKIASWQKWMAAQAITIWRVAQLS